MFHIFYKSFHESSVHHSHTVCLFRLFLSTAQLCRGQYRFLKTKEQLSNKWIMTLSICICWNTAVVCAAEKNALHSLQNVLSQQIGLSLPLVCTRRSFHSHSKAGNLMSPQQRRFSGMSVDWVKYLSACLYENYTNGAWRIKAGTPENLPHNSISQHHIDLKKYQSILVLINIYICMKIVKYNV